MKIVIVNFFFKFQVSVGKVKIIRTPQHKALAIIVLNMAQFTIISAMLPDFFTNIFHIKLLLKHFYWVNPFQNILKLKGFRGAGGSTKSFKGGAVPLGNFSQGSPLPLVNKVKLNSSTLCRIIVTP